MRQYFSDQEQGARPRIEQEISSAAWGGIIVLVRSLIASGAFGADFPEECPDGRGTCGTDGEDFMLALRAEVPDLPERFFDGKDVPPTLLALDVIQFCHQHVAKPKQIDHHGFYGHWHLAFDREEGQRNFRESVKRIFARNGLAYEVTESGDIVRLGPPVLVDELRQAVFRTGDRELDTMLEMARTKFLSPDPRVRRESLEKLWDAWERVKSLEDADKKTSVERLLAQASPDSTFRDRLNAEAKELTELGNRFQIRHSETSQTPIALDEHVDYLFHRLFAMIQLVLRRRGSGGGED